MTKIEKFCDFYIIYRRDAELAEIFYKGIFSLRALRLCGRPDKNDRIPFPGGITLDQGKSLT